MGFTRDRVGCRPAVRPSPRGMQPSVDSNNFDRMSDQHESVDQLNEQVKVDLDATFDGDMDFFEEDTTDVDFEEDTTALNATFDGDMDFQEDTTEQKYVEI